MNTLHESFTQALGISEAWKLGVGGNYIRIKALSAGVAVTLRFFNHNVRIGEVAGAEAGERYNVQDEFDRVDIVNGGTAQTVTVVIGNGESTSSSLAGSVTVTNGYITAKLEGPGNAINFSATVGITEGLVVGSYTNYKKQVFRADPANISDIALGATGLTLATSAIVLAPGQSFTLDASECGPAIYGIAGAAGQKLYGWYSNA